MSVATPFLTKSAFVTKGTKELVKQKVIAKMGAGAENLLLLPA